MSVISVKQSRFELRLSVQDKNSFERASRLSGYKTMSSFITEAVRAKAKEVIDEYEAILVSEKDKNIFFNALLSNIEPNNKLKGAVKKYKSFKFE